MNLSHTRFITLQPRRSRSTPGGGEQGKESSTENRVRRAVQRTGKGEQYREKGKESSTESRVRRAVQRKG